MTIRNAFAVSAALLLLGSGVASADCRSGAQPAATLLFPYFEVDLSGTTGRTTLIAIGNSLPSEPALAHVILWTDRGIATLAFDLYLTPNDVQTINLRDIFLSGSLPVTGGPGFEGCGTPITLPPLGEAERATLRNQHTGQPAGGAGLCWSSDAGGPVALGFVTVDAVNSCSASIQLPNDEGYFVNGGAGIASNENRLYGDFFLVDSAENFAQGGEAVHLVADATRFGGGLLPTFYEMANLERNDNRSPLPTRHRTRFLNGGLFDGGTDLLLFVPYPGFGFGTPAECGQPFGGVCHQLRFRATNESGVSEEPFIVYDDEYGGPVAARLAVGEPPLEVGFLFGHLDVDNQELLGCLVTPIGTERLQAHVMPVHSAEGRLSVGLNAIALESACDPSPLPD
jgi:hypothetical protein